MSKRQNDTTEISLKKRFNTMNFDTYRTKLVTKPAPPAASPSWGIDNGGFSPVLEMDRMRFWKYE